MVFPNKEKDKDPFETAMANFAAGGIEIELPKPAEQQSPVTPATPLSGTGTSGGRSIDEILKSTGGVPEDFGQGGWRTVVQKGMGPLGTLFKALSLPLAVTSSALKETIDFAQGEGWSYGDFKEQAEEGYTFGRLLHDENWMQGGVWEDKWGAGWFLRGAISFTGDVALDPLSYVGLVGKGVAAGNVILKGAKLGGGDLASHSLRRHIVEGFSGGTARFGTRFGTAAIEEGKLKNLAQILGDSGPAFTVRGAAKDLGYDAKHAYRQLNDGDWVVDLDVMSGVKPKKTANGYIMDIAKKNPEMISTMENLVLIPKSLVDDIKGLYKLEGVSGLSGFADDQIQLVSKHMHLNKMDKNGLPFKDYLSEMQMVNAGQKIGTEVAEHARWKGALFNSAEEAASVKMAAGLKIPLAGPIGRSLKIPWAAGKGYPASLKIARVPFSMPIIGPAVGALPKAARRVAFGAGDIGYGRGVIGWMRTGGRMQAQRAIAKSGSATAVQRHQARAALSAAGRGQWKGRIIKTQMAREAGNYLSQVKASKVELPDGGTLRGDELEKTLYHALGGDTDAIIKIQGHANLDPVTNTPIFTEPLLRDGQVLFNKLRNIANEGAGYEFVGEVPFYVPRILNEEAREYIQRRSGTFGLKKGRISNTDALTQHELKRSLISDNAFDELVAKKVAKGKTKATAIWELGNEGVTKGFMGYELFDVGSSLPDGHAWVLSNRVASGKAPSIEKQIAFVMEDLQIGYELFDDNISRALSAYIGGLSIRTGDVFTEEVLKRKGVFVDRIASLTTFPTQEMDKLTFKLHGLSRSINNGQQKLDQLAGDLAASGEGSISNVAWDNSNYALKKQQLDDAMEAHALRIKEYEEAEFKLNEYVEKQIKQEEIVDGLETTIIDLNKQSENTRIELARLASTDFKEIMPLQKKMNRIQELVVQAKGDGNRIRLYAQSLRTGTRELMKNKQIISSIVGGQENFDVYRQVIGKFDPSIHRNVDEFVSAQLADVVDENGIGEAFDGLVKSSGFVGTVTDETPNGFQWQMTMPDGSARNNVQVNTDLMKMVSVLDNLDQTAFGTNVSMTVQIGATMDNLVVNPVAQFDNMLATIEKSNAKAQNVLTEIEQIIGREGIQEEILGKLPTVANVEEAQATILRKVDEGIAKNASSPMDLRTSDTLRTDPEFREAILTFYGTMGNDLRVRPIESGSEIQSAISQIENDLYDQLAIYQFALEENPVIPPMKIQIDTDGVGQVVVEKGLQDFINLKEARDMWQMQMGALSTNNLADVTTILKNGRVIQASAAAKGKGVNPVARLNNRIQAVQGGTNVGFHIRTNIEGDELDFYIKRYDPNLEQGDEAAVFTEYGHTIDDVARNRVQSEVLADALYRRMDTLATGRQTSKAAPNSWQSSTDSFAPDFLRQQANAGDFMVGDMLQNGQWKIAKFSDGLAFPQGSPPISDVSVIKFKNGTHAIASSPEELARYQAQANVNEVVPFSQRIKEQMLMDILVSNSDVVGYDADNIGIDMLTGAVVRIDNGASFHYRAQGLSKANTQGFDWRAVDELENADGSMGTFFSEEFENQPSKWQTMFRSEMQENETFWFELGIQFETIAEMRSGYGGWEGFVKQTLGPEATANDVEMFTDWLEVRTKNLQEVLGNHLEETPPLLEGKELMEAKLASNFDEETVKNIISPAHTAQQRTSQKEGLPSWISNDGETQAIKSFSVRDAIREVRNGTKLNTADREGILRDVSVLKEFERWSKSNPDVLEAMSFGYTPNIKRADDIQFQKSLFEEDAADTVLMRPDEYPDFTEKNFAKKYDEAYLNNDSEALADLEDYTLPEWEQGDYVEELGDGLSLGNEPPSGRGYYEDWVETNRRNKVKDGIAGLTPDKYTWDVDEAVDNALWSGSMTDTVTPDGRSIRYGVVVVDADGNVVMRMPTDTPSTGEPFGGVKWSHAKGGMDEGETPIEAAMREAREELNINVNVYGALPEVDEQTANSVSRYFIAKVANGTPAIDKVPSSAAAVQERMSFYVQHGYGKGTSNMSGVRPKDFSGTQNVPRSSWLDSLWINTTQADATYSPQGMTDATIFSVDAPRGSDSIKILGLPPVHQTQSAAEYLMKADPYNPLTEEGFDAFRDIHHQLDSQIVDSIKGDPNVKGAARLFTSYQQIDGGAYTPNRNKAWRDHELTNLEYAYREDGDTYDELINYLRQGDTERKLSDVSLNKDQEDFLKAFDRSETVNHKNARLNLGAETLETMKALDNRNIAEWDILSFNEKLSFIGYLELQGGNAAPWEQIYLGRAKGAQLSEEEISFLSAVAPMGATRRGAGEAAFDVAPVTSAAYMTEGLYRNIKGATDIVEESDFGSLRGLDPLRHLSDQGPKETISNIRFKNDRRSAVEFAQTLDNYTASGDHWNLLDIDNIVAENAIASHSSDFYLENQEFISSYVARIAEVRSGGTPFTNKEIEDLRNWAVSDVMNKLETHRQGLIRLQSASEMSIKKDLAFFNALNSDKNLGFVNQQIALDSPIVKNLVGGQYSMAGNSTHHYMMPANEYTGGTILDVPVHQLQGIDPKQLRKEIVNKLQHGTPEQRRMIFEEMGIDVAKLKKTSTREEIDDILKMHFNEYQGAFNVSPSTIKNNKPLDFMPEVSAGRAAGSAPTYTQLTSYLNAGVIGQVSPHDMGIPAFQADSIMSHLQKMRAVGSEQIGGLSAKKPFAMFDPKTGKRISSDSTKFDRVLAEVQKSKLGATEMSTSGNPIDTYPALRANLIDEMESFGDAQIIPEALLYPKMLESMKKGLAADGYGAMAFYHNEAVYAPKIDSMGNVIDAMITPTGSAMASADATWANVLLANPVSVVNPNENLTRTAEGLAYSVRNFKENPVITGQKFVDEYEQYAKTILADERNLAGRKAPDAWAQARAQNPDNPLEALVSNQRKAMLQNQDKAYMAIDAYTQSIIRLENEISTLGMSWDTKQTAAGNLVREYKVPKKVEALQIEVSQLKVKLEGAAKAEELIEKITRQLPQDVIKDDMYVGAPSIVNTAGQLGNETEALIPALRESVALLNEEMQIVAEEFIANAQRIITTSNDLNQAAKKFGKEGQDYVNAKWLNINKWDENKIDDFVKTFENTFASGYRPYGVGSQGPQEIVNSMGDVIKWQADGGMRKFLRTYDSVHNLVKGYLIGKTGFHSRNFFSGVFMNSLAGVGNPKTYRRFQNAYWKSQYQFAQREGLDKYAQSLKNSMRKRGIWENISQVNPEHVKIIDQMREGGILGGGQIGGAAIEFDVAKRLPEKLGSPKGILRAINKVNPMSSRNAFLQANRNIGIGTETYLRGVLGFDTILKGGSVDDAFENVIKYHFDYDDLSMFERGVIKRIYPFYVWTKRALPLMAEEVFKQPKKFARVEHFKKEFTGYGEKDNAPVPDYFVRQGGFETPWSYKGEKMWMLPDLPQKVLAETIDPFFTTSGTPIDKAVGGLSTLASNLSPLLKAPLERGTSRNFWKGYNYDGRFVQVPTAFNISGMTEALLTAGIYKQAQNGKIMVRDYDMNMLMTMLPILGDVRRLLPDEQRYQDRALSTYLSYFTGIGLRTNTQAEQQRTLQSQGYEQEEIDNMLRWMERESLKDK